MQTKLQDILKPGPKVVNRKYAACSGILGNIATISDCVVEPYDYENEDCDLRSPEVRQCYKQKLILYKFIYCK